MMAYNSLHDNTYDNLRFTKCGFSQRVFLSVNILGQQLQHIQSSKPKLQQDSNKINGMLMVLLVSTQ